MKTNWLWMAGLMLINVNHMKVHGCLDMLIKEFTQMFAGPGGSLIGSSNSNNLDRIRIFNNYQSPSIDEIQDEQNLENKFDESEDSDEYEDDNTKYGTQWKRGRDKVNSKMKLMKINEKNFKQSRTKNEAKNNREKSTNVIRSSMYKNKANRISDINKKSAFKRENIEEDDDNIGHMLQENRKLKDGSKKMKAKNIFSDENVKGLFQRKSSEHSLYNLEPKTSDYNSKYYKANHFDDDVDDDRTFQTRDDVSNVPKTKKIDQPFINMITNILDTIQLTSKHDYKRAKEKELRDHARWKAHSLQSV